ncbi:MAG: hypothetical protein WCQ50_08940, partial [Spirochaetota bacterium]
YATDSGGARCLSLFDELVSRHTWAQQFMALSDWTASSTALPLVETEVRVDDGCGEVFCRFASSVPHSSL